MIFNSLTFQELLKRKMLNKPFFVILCLMIFNAFLGNSQQFQFWNEIGLKSRPMKSLETSLSFSSRWDDFGCDRLFPEISMKSKIHKGLTFSLDYRLISKRENYNQYSTNNRCNVNLKYKTKLNRFKLSCRVRYQFANVNLSDNYDSDFDAAWRVKPMLEFNEKKSKIAYLVSFETFYNPQWGIDGRKINKLRYALGTKYNLKGPNEIYIGFQIDQYVNNTIRPNRMILKTAYSYDLKFKKKSKSEDLKTI